jgi:hypothetical protein
MIIKSNSVLLFYNQLFVRISFFLFSILITQNLSAQDSLVFDGKKAIQLREVVIRKGINVPAFIARVKEDTTFYKAFRNLHLLNFVSQNDIRINDKSGQLKASLQSRTRQTVKDHCRTMEVLEEKTTGDFYDGKGAYNYYTAELYAGLFFTKGRKCNETNIVKGVELNPKGKKGLEKSKEQLKMLFFNPGKKIPGIPFIGNKINIFDDEMAGLYDFSIDYEALEEKNCYVFRVKAREDLDNDQKDQLVIDEMNTWFDVSTMEVLFRNYRLSYDAGVYDFDVNIEVAMTKIGKYLVPSVLRYIGNWKVMFRKRERAVFTAVLSQFSE